MVSETELALGVIGTGLVFLLELAGILVLVLPGRLDPERARPLGLGRHVEALLLVSFLTSAYFAGFGNVPVWIDENGIVAFSLTGAILPFLLSAHFLWRAGWLNGLLALVGVAASSAVAFAVSQPREEMGIVSEFPYYFLPSVVAATAGLVLGRGRLASVPIAYACGTLGPLIGADLLRVGWVVRTAKPVGGSFGGAEVQDLVFLGGVWAAALAAIPLVGYWTRLRRPVPAWEEVAARASRGDLRGAIERGVALVNGALSLWAGQHGLAGRPALEVRAASRADPILAGAEALLWASAVDPEDARTALESLEALHRRLVRPRRSPPAHGGRRLAAGIIDLLIPAGAVVLAALLLAPVHLDALERESDSGDVEREPEKDRRAREVFVKTLFVVWVGLTVHIVYPLVAEWTFRGATLGKALVGLRVRRVDGSRATGWDCLVRNMARLVDLALLYLVAFLSPTDSGKQRLGDYFAGTTVVYLRATEAQTALMATPIPMPTQASAGTQRTSRAPR